MIVVAGAFVDLNAAIEINAVRLWLLIHKNPVTLAAVSLCLRKTKIDPCTDGGIIVDFYSWL